MPASWPPDGYVNDRFEYGGIRRDVFRPKVVAGPPVLIFHELGGLNDFTLGVARAVAGDGGLSPILPALVGPAGRRRLIGNLGRLCVGWEFVTWASNETSPIVGWLRALAARESERAGGTKVGVVGMCFSGGFALAMAVDPGVAVAIASQPSLPFTLFGFPAGRARDLGLSRGDLSCAKARAEAGAVTVRSLRYSGDKMSPRARRERYGREFGGGAIPPEIPGRRHSVLADGAAGVNANAADALRDVVALLRERLISPPAGPPGTA